MVHIIIAAKDGPVRKALRAMLIGVGYKISCAGDGGEALDILRQSDVALILADVRMPVMDGIALSIAARREFPQLKVLMMSEDRSFAAKLTALDVMTDSIIQKPFSVQALRREVDRLLPGRLHAA